MTRLCKNPKESTKYLLELKSKFSKVVEFKVNIQKSIIFLYISNEQLEFQINKNTNDHITKN